MEIFRILENSSFEISTSKPEYIFSTFYETNPLGPMGQDCVGNF